MKSFFLRIAYKAAALYYGRRYADISRRDEARDIFADEPRREIAWPGGARFVCNVQFDDFCALSKQNGPYDFGGAVGEGVNAVFAAFLDAYPEVRVTVFSIPRPTFKNYRGIYYGDTGDRYDLSHPANSAAALYLRSRAPQVEIACHGYGHIGRAIPFYLAPMEFEFASAEETQRDIAAARAIFSSLGIPIAGFRPPAWGVGENNGFAFIEGLRAHAFRYVSLSSPYSGLNRNEKRVSNVYPDRYAGMLTMPQNVSLGWSIDRIIAAVDRIAEYGGVLTLMGHYSGQDDWMEDGIGKRTIGKIEAVLAHINERYGADSVWHATLAEVADFWHNQQDARRG